MVRTRRTRPVETSCEVDVRRLHVVRAAAAFGIAVAPLESGSRPRPIYCAAGEARALVAPEGGPPPGDPRSRRTRAPGRARRVTELRGGRPRYVQTADGRLPRARAEPGLPRARPPAQSRQRFVIGVRRSRPNAFGRSFTPGGAWRRLYSARSMSAIARSTISRLEAVLGQLLARAVELDVRLEHLVERGIRRQRVLVELVGPELGARRPLDDRHRDELPAGPLVQMPGEPEDVRLVDVLDQRESAGQVAVESGVADRELRLVAGRDHEPAELVRERHQEVPRILACRFSSVRSGSRPAKDGASAAVERPDHRLDRELAEVDAERLGEPPRVVLRSLRRVARRHRDAVHALGAERPDREGGRDRGVDAARERRSRRRRTRSCARSRAARARGRAASARGRRAAAPAPAARPLLAARRRRARASPARLAPVAVERERAEAHVAKAPRDRAHRVDVDDEQLLLEARARARPARPRRRARREVPSNISSSWPPTRLQ